MTYLRFCPHMIVIGLLGSASGFAQDAVRLTEKAPPGTEFRVVAEVSIRGELLAPVAKDKPPEKINIAGKSTIDYTERLLPPDEHAEQKVLRYYDKIDFRKTTADRTDEMTLRPEVKRIVLMKRGAAKLTFSPDGPLTFGEVDMLRTDMIIPALVGLLPTKDVRLNDTWTAAPSAVAELTDMDKVEKGSLSCKLEKIETTGPRKIAHVSFTGLLEGVNEDGPMKQSLTGKLLVDLNANLITYLRVIGDHALLDEKGQQVGKINGSFEMTRSSGGVHKALSGDGIKGLALAPNDDTTRLLHDADGVRFAYPRTWKVIRSSGRQITLDEQQGSGMLITVEPVKSVPNTQVYLKETIKDLRDRGAKVNALYGPDALVEGTDRFTLDVTLEKENFTMDYVVVKQTNGGATLAVRIPEKFRDVRMKEVERIARSFTVPRKLDEK